MSSRYDYKPDGTPRYYPGLDEAIRRLIFGRRELSATKLRKTLAAGFRQTRTARALRLGRYRHAFEMAMRGCDSVLADPFEPSLAIEYWMHLADATAAVRQLDDEVAFRKLATEACPPRCLAEGPDAAWAYMEISKMFHSRGEHASAKENAAVAVYAHTFNAHTRIWAAAIDAAQPPHTTVSLLAQAFNLDLTCVKDVRASPFFADKQDVVDAAVAKILPRAMSYVS